MIRSFSPSTPFLLVLVLVLILVQGASSCVGGGHSVNAYAGLRTLDSDDFSDAKIDDQNVYGADVVLKLDLPLLAVEGGWFHSDDEEAGTKVDIDEYFFGLRVTPWTFLVAPYAAVGLTYLDADLSGAGSDSNLGYYARVGAAIPFGILRVGLDGRAAWSDNLDFDTLESDVTNYQLALFVGVGF